MTPSRPPTRRDVLQGLAAAGLVAALPASLLAAPRTRRRRTVIWLHLRGGNDALATVAPMRDARYRRLRPTLAPDPDAVLDLADGRTLAPALQGLHGLWKRDRLAIVEGVSWPRPDLSHFRSTALWHAGRERTIDGWAGRALANESHGLRAVALADEPPLLLEGAGPTTAVFREPSALAEPADADAVRLLYRAGAISPRAVGEVARVGAEALDVASRLARLAPVPLTHGGAGGPGPSRLATDLGLALALVASEPDLAVVSLAHDGYDTHANQAATHAALLGDLGRSLASFQGEVERRGLGDRVAVFVWSEFGRRAAENASAGTDHGTAGVVFVVAEGLQPGLYGAPPALDDLRDGNLVPTTDLRRVEAEALAYALDVDPVPVLGPHAPLEILS